MLGGPKDSSHAHSKFSRPLFLPPFTYFMPHYHLGKDRLAHVPQVTGVFPHRRRCGCENRTGIASAFHKQNHFRPVRAIDNSEQTRRPTTVDRSYCSQESGCNCFHSSQLAHRSHLLFLFVPTARAVLMAKLLRRMVPRDGVEPPTPAFSGLRSTT